MDKTKSSKPRISENLSSDTLYTFTPKLEYLIDILRHGIFPRYIYERLPIPNKTWYYIVAAKCFCDIPLGKIKSHLDWFGNYGLGINRTYLREKGVTPLMYMHKDSEWIVNSLLRYGLAELGAHPSLPFLKRHYGDDYKREDNGEYTQTRRKFYDEREWRYVPKDVALTKGDDIKEIKNGIELVRNMNLEHPIREFSIPLSPMVIEYIIIEKFDEFKELKLELRNLYPDDDIYELMLSKILIAKRIVKDF